MQSANTVSIIKTDIAIIGAGMAGLAAAVFAANRGFSTVITGKRSSMNFATGLMDLMGVYPTGREWDNPWQAIELVRKEIPNHPYFYVTDEEIRDSLSEIEDFLKAQGLSYRMSSQNNVNIITSLGTMKKSYLIPEPMWKGVVAFEQKAPTLFIDFFGLKIYSANQIVSTLSKIWTTIKSARVDFPNMERLEEVYPEHIARSLDIEENRIKLAKIIRPLLDNGQFKFEYIGFPALLGMYRSNDTVTQLEQLLGVSIFEIPTPPVSVPGIRLHEALTNGLAQRKNLIYEPEMVEQVEQLENGVFKIKIADSMAQKECFNLNEVLNNASEHNVKNLIAEADSDDSIQIGRRQIESRAIILATGRFMGKGLEAKRTGIRESLFDIPVTQPSDRERWHQIELFHPEGHPVNRAGIEVDKMMRPLSRLGKPFAENLFAAGSIIAHSDWTRMKCGSGVAITTAFAAVKYLESIFKS